MHAPQATKIFGEEEPVLMEKLRTAGLNEATRRTQRSYSTYST